MTKSMAAGYFIPVNPGKGCAGKGLPRERKRKSERLSLAGQGLLHH
jgi:hypothetical protein